MRVFAASWALPLLFAVAAGGNAVNLAAEDKHPRQSVHRTRDASLSLNIGFAHDPGQGHYDGVIGSPDDVWNFVDIGTTAVDYMRHANATGSTARLRVTRHDGEWGVKGHQGIFRGYIYHNFQCVDLEATLLGLSPSRYRAYVYAHGDAPNQNAQIEVIVGDRTLGRKATGNDGTWDFRATDFTEGVQYVCFEFDVVAGQDVRIISHRDGSGYSMFNAIQLVPIQDAIPANKRRKRSRTRGRRQSRADVGETVPATAP